MSFCLYSAMFSTYLGFLLVILLFQTAPKYSAQARSSFPKCRKAVSFADKTCVRALIRAESSLLTMGLRLINQIYVSVK